MGVILIVGTLVFGPDKMPDLARTLAGIVRRLRQLADSARADLRAELGSEFVELDLSDVNPRAVLRKQLAEILDDEPAHPDDRTP